MHMGRWEGQCAYRDVGEVSKHKGGGRDKCECGEVGSVYRGGRRGKCIWGGGRDSTRECT